jgi:hypothetical protein
LNNNKTKYIAFDYVDKLGKKWLLKLYQDENETRLLAEQFKYINPRSENPEDHKVVQHHDWYDNMPIELFAKGLVKEGAIIKESVGISSI